MTMTAKSLATVIERDILKANDCSSPDTTKCFSCDHSILYRGSRFCSDRCRAWYDDGNPGFDQDWLQPRKLADAPLSDLKVIAGPPDLPVGSAYYDQVFGKPMTAVARRTRNGYLISCAHCRKEFDSTGLRCCSTTCERKYREREESRKLLAEAGIETAPKRVCENCGGIIPKWQNGRLVSSAKRFCSDRCRQAKSAKAII